MLKMFITIHRDENFGVVSVRFSRLRLRNPSFALALAYDRVFRSVVAVDRQSETGISSGFSKFYQSTRTYTCRQ